MYRVAGKSLLRVRDGFHGCLASLRLNGPPRDLLGASFQLPPHAAAFITPGCDGQTPFVSSPFEAMVKFGVVEGIDNLNRIVKLRSLTAPDACVNCSSSNLKMAKHDTENSILRAKTSK